MLEAHQSQQYVTTDSPHINPDNGEWDRQLPNPDLVSQLDPPTAPEHPTLKPKIFDRLAWADGVVRARRYRGPTAAVFHRQTVRAGTEAGCFESVDNMASGLGISRSSVQRAIKTISKDGYMAIEQRHGQTYLCRPDFTKGVSLSRQGVSDRHPPGGVTVTPKGKPSSSNIKIKERTPDQIVNLKQEGPSAEDQDHVSTSSLSFLEEEKTGVTPTPPTPLPADERIVQAQEWVEVNITEVPRDAEIEGMLAYCWSVWKHPEHPHGWKYGQAAAFKHCTADFAARKKFRVDLVEHLAKKGPPPTDADGHLLKREVWCEAGKHFTKTPVGATMEDKGNGRWFSDQCSYHLLEV